MATADPRDRITPDAFTVAPHLLGLPLARPWRRLVAIAADLLILRFLILLGGMVLSFAIALAAFWLAARTKRERSDRRISVLPLRVIGVVALLIGLILLGTRLFRAEIEEGLASAAYSGRLGTGARQIGVAMRVGRELQAVQSATTEAEAQAAVARAEQSLRELEQSPEEIREQLLAAAEETPAERPWVARALLDAAERLPAREVPPPASPAELAEAYASAQAAGDSLRADTLRTRLLHLLGADTLTALQAEIERLREENLELRERPEPEVRRWDPLGFIRRSLEELGLGLGWSGLYFTVFVVIWRGQTPGKRLLGIRVVRLNGGPITWWGAFERFGGYAAGLATGLLGFLQVYWDPNRQAIHDKIMETVVVRALEIPTAAPPSVEVDALAQEAPTSQPSPPYAGEEERA